MLGEPAQSRAGGKMAQTETKPAIRKGRKFDQVLEGARKIFLRDGFEGASVDDIAREAGVSKATLYSYFPDKKLLFLEVARGECARQADEAGEQLATGAPPREVLSFAGGRIVEFMSSDFGFGFFRICVAEGDRFPQLKQGFYQAGPMLLHNRLVAYLKGAVERGELTIEDFDLAADQFIELCKADIHARLLFEGSCCCNAHHIKRTVDGAVEMFLARYGVKG